MASAFGFIGGGLLSGLGKGLATQGIEEGKAKRERVHAELEHQRNLERDKINNNARVGLLTARQKAESERFGSPIAGLGPAGDPEFRQFTPGGQSRPVPDFTPVPKANVTPTQNSNNIKIDNARKILAGLGFSREEINRKTVRAEHSGRENLEYDQYLDRVVRTATQRKTGADPDFERVYQRVYGQPPPPIPEPGFDPLETGTSTVNAGPPPPRTGRAAPQAGQPPPAGGSGAALPAVPRPRPGAGTPAPGGRGAASLPLDLKARMDRNEIFTEAELREILRTRPEVYAALRAYLEDRNQAGLGFVGP